ncbi:MAG: hypothetical protein ACI865_003068 [Flavobacteriaceae bacterium]
MNPEKLENSPKLKFINRLIGVSLISQLLISWPLWENAIRELPMAPVIDGLDFGVFNPVLIFSLLGALVILILKPMSTGVIITTLSLFFLLVLEDQSRLQPWLYLYSIMLLCTVFFRGKNAAHLSFQTIFLILAVTYFWSGVQKTNYFFGTEMFPWLADFTGQEDFLRAHPQFGYAVGITEALAGLALLFKPSRKAGAVVVLVMHLFILGALGPFGHDWNHVVWPWNICFGWILILLVWRIDKDANRLSPFTRARYSLFCFVLVGILPVLGIFDRWDHFLSGGYYSCAVPDSIFYYHENDRSQMPESTAAFQFHNMGTQEEFVLLDQWGLDQLGAPLYPEIRVKKQVAKQMCDCVTMPESAGVRINSKNRFTGKSETLEVSCDEL